MPKYLVIKERESGKWVFDRELPYRKTTQYNPRTGRNKKVYVQDTHIYPKPENISCFIEAHRIIEVANQADVGDVVKNMNQGGNDG